MVGSRRPALGIGARSLRMCGFVAIAGADATAPGRIEAGVAAIRHRGPDGDGVWRSPDGRASLGHARLAIIDVSNLGAQPMRSADGRAVISYNGEIYNFREIASRVDVPLRSRCDTEVIVELLRKYGADAVRLLRGMFAFAYWDGEELLLVRDRLGIKPVFYADEGERIVAASEIGAVLALRQTRPEIDGRAIDDYLTYLYVPPPRTGIVGVRELPPGHLLRWKPGGGAIVERYWTVPSHTALENARPARVRELLEEAVRMHLVSDVPLGVFLSGGLDSSSIVAFASRHYPGTLRTFCVTFGDEGRYLDERGFAREVASRFGTDHREIHVEADVARILPELVEHFGQPFGNPTSVLTYALSLATREHVKVALAGDGGDEVFGGYPRYQGVWLAELTRRVPASVRRSALHAIERFAPKHAARGLPANRLRRFLEHADQLPDPMYFNWVSHLDEERKASLLADRDALLADDRPREPFEFLADARRRHGDVPMRDAASLVDLESFLPCNVLAYGDRMSMAHALEVRVPFCDHVLVEQLAPLPLAMKAPGGLQKGLFRWAMRRELPARIVVHRKVGFNPPIASWLRGDLAPLADDYLSERSIRERGVFASSAVKELRDGFAAGYVEMAHSLWSIVVAEAWMRWLGRGALSRVD
jgi:asparagine synthase (glutamine-hydrolysing)